MGIPGYPEDWDGRSIRPSRGYGNLGPGGLRGSELVEKARCINTIFIKDRDGIVNKSATNEARKDYAKKTKIPFNSKWYPKGYSIHENNDGMIVFEEAK